jgi:hypothetical protein
MDVSGPGTNGNNTHSRSEAGRVESSVPLYMPLHHVHRLSGWPLLSPQIQNQPTLTSTIVVGAR